MQDGWPNIGPAAPDLPDLFLQPCLGRVSAKKTANNNVTSCGNSIVKRKATKLHNVNCTPFGAIEYKG